MNDGDKLLLSLRVVGEPLDILEEPYAFDIRDGALLLYREPEPGHQVGLPYAGYNLELLERFEVVPAAQVDDVEHKIQQTREGKGVNLENKDPKENPFVGGKLKFKEGGA